MQKVLYPDRVGDSLSHGLLSSPALNVVHRYGGSCDQQNYRDENPDNRQRRFFTHLSNSLSETLFYWTLGDGEELKAEREKTLIGGCCVTLLVVQWAFLCQREIKKALYYKRCDATQFKSKLIFGDRYKKKFLQIGATKLNTFLT